MQRARVIADTLSPAGSRLTTLEVTFPRIVLAEFNTHRVFSRNSASTRAIPTAKALATLRADPYVPDRWLANCRGMSPVSEVDADTAARAAGVYNRAMAAALAAKSRGRPTPRPGTPRASPWRPSWTGGSPRLAGAGCRAR